MKIFNYLLVLTLLSSCKENLDNSKAEELIVDFFEYPNAMVAQTKTNHHLLDSDDFSSKFLEYGLYEKYTNSNGIMHQIRPRVDLYRYLIDEGVDFPDNKSKNRKSFRIFLGERKFDKITGIKINESTKEARIEFSVKLYNLSPFGQALGYTEEGVTNHYIEAELYEDGWRIKSNTPRFNYKLSHFSKLNGAETEMNNSSIEPKNNLPFIGTRFFNFYGGSGTLNSITIDENGNTIIKSHGMAGDFIDYEGPFTNPLSFPIGDESTATYKISGESISILNQKGEIEKDCLGDGKPCTAGLYLN
jgi:hypothetical protein